MPYNQGMGIIASGVGVAYMLATSSSSLIATGPSLKSVKTSIFPCSASWARSPARALKCRALAIHRLPLRADRKLLSSLAFMRHRLAIATVFCSALATGCDSRPYGLAPVSGIVTLDGQPIEKARVSFQPQGGSKTNPGPGSYAFCDASGRYELKTIRDEPGAVPGPHAVRITSPQPKADSASDTDTGPAFQDPIPPRYNYQTELTFTVPEEGTDSANFELISK